MSYLHRIVGIGNLTHSPELRYLPSGDGVCNCTIAVNDTYQTDGQEVRDVIFWEVDFFGTIAEKVSARNYQKGDLMYFEGSPKITLYTKKDGTPAIRCKARFGRVVKLSSARNGQGDYHAAPGEDAEPDEVFQAPAPAKITEPAF